MKKIIFLLGAISVLFSELSLSGDLNQCKNLDHKSYESCERLAQAGNPDGMFGQGMLLLEGIGIAQNYDRSFELMYQAAMLGHAGAQLQVGQAYVNGQGVKQDFEEGYAWLLISKENGNPVAQKGIDIIDRSNLIQSRRMNAVTQRENDLYSMTKNKNGFQFDPSESTQPVNDLAEYCDMVMPTVDGLIMYKKYGKPKSEAQQLMIGMTDRQAIKMMNGVIDWVWSSNIPVHEMSRNFKAKCLSQSPEISFMFP